MTHQESLVLDTRGHGDVQRIDDAVAAVVGRSGIRTGVAHIFNVGSTGAVGMIEFEPGLRKDLPAVLDRLIPPGRNYGHEQTWHDGNAHSHLQASLLGPSMTLPVRKGQLALGTWQQIVHVECDVTAREREIVVTVMGE